MAGALIGALRVSLGIDATQFEDGVKGASRAAKRFEKDMKRTGEKLSKAGKWMTFGITAPFIGFAVHAAKAASDAGELNAAFGETFGEMTDAVSEWARVTGDAMGRSTNEMKNGANTFGIYFNQAAKTKEQAAEMSKTFTVLAQDLSSSFNSSPDEAIQALRSGLSGETEPLRKYGVFLSDATMKSKAAEMGIKGVNGKLTDQQKIMVRAALIMENTTKVQGDVIRTSDSSANRARALASAWEELSIAVGDKLLPILTPLITAATNLLNKFAELSPETQKWIMIAAGIAAVIGPVVWIVGSFVTALGWLLPLLAGVGGAGAAAGVGAGAAATGLGALNVALGSLLLALIPLAVAVGAVYLAWKNWDKIAPVLDSFAKSFDESAKANGEALDAFAKAFDQSAADVHDWLVSTGASFDQSAANAGDWLQEMAKSFDESSASAHDWLVQTGEYLGNLAIEGIGAMQKLYSGVKDWIGTKLTAVFDGVKEKITAVGDWFYNLYDRVVGHSYVPDLLEGIAANFNKLDAYMVEPTKKGTKKVGDAFKKLAEDLRPILERLFPEAAALKTYRDELGTLEAALKKGMITQEQFNESVKRLETERGKDAKDALEKAAQEKADALQALTDGLFPNEAEARTKAGQMKILKDALDSGTISQVRFNQAMSELNIDKEQASRIEQLMDKLFPDRVKLKERKESLDLLKELLDTGKIDIKTYGNEVQQVLADTATETEDKTAKIISSYAEMARNVVGSLRSMVDNFKKGDILGGIQSILDLVVSVVGAVRMVQGKPALPSAAPAPRAPGYSTGGSFKVGGSGGIDSQLIRLRASPGEQISVRRGDQMENGRRDPIVVYVKKGEMFDAHVERVAAPLADHAAVRGALGGAAKARMDSIKAQRNRLA